MSYLLSLLLISGLCSATASKPGIEPTNTLTIGSISNAPKEEIQEFQPFIDYLVSSLNHPTIKTGRVVIASSLQEMSELINKGLVDIYIDSPFPVIAIEKTTQSVPFMRRWKKGVSEYRSVIFTHKDTGINSLEELKGNMLAFEEEFSTSGYFLPKATLIANKLAIVEKKRKNIPVAREEIGYTFSKDDETTMIWVLKKKVAAGALNKRAFTKLAKSKLKELVIIKETILVPRQIVMHSPNLPISLRDSIKEVLLNMDSSDQGKIVLTSFAKTKKFELIRKSELDEISGLFDLIATEFSF